MMKKQLFQFKTRVHKPYPILDRPGRNWYPISDQNGWRKHTLWQGTYLYSLYKGLPPPSPGGGGEKRVADYESRYLRKLTRRETTNDKREYLKNE